MKFDTDAPRMTAKAIRDKRVLGLLADALDYHRQARVKMHAGMVSDAIFLSWRAAELRLCARGIALGIPDRESWRTVYRLRRDHPLATR